MIMPVSKDQRLSAVSIETFKGIYDSIKDSRSKAIPTAPVSITDLYLGVRRRFPLVKTSPTSIKARAKACGLELTRNREIIDAIIEETLLSLYKALPPNSRVGANELVKSVNKAIKDLNIYADNLKVSGLRITLGRLRRRRNSKIRKIYCKNDVTVVVTDQEIRSAYQSLIKAAPSRVPSRIELRNALGNKVSMVAISRRADSLKLKLAYPKDNARAGLLKTHETIREAALKLKSTLSRWPLKIEIQLELKNSRDSSKPRRYPKSLFSFFESET
jgi:hypothetical protein